MKGMLDLKFVYMIVFVMGVCFFMLGFGGVIISFIGAVMMGEEISMIPFAIGSLILSVFLLVSSLTLFGCYLFIGWYQKHKNPDVII